MIIRIIMIAQTMKEVRQSRVEKRKINSEIWKIMLTPEFWGHVKLSYVWRRKSNIQGRWVIRELKRGRKKMFPRN